MTVKLFVQLVRNPQKTEIIFNAVDLLVADPNDPAIRQVVDEALGSEFFQDMLKSDYRPVPPSLQQLSLMPDSSFGQALYQYLSSNHIDFNIFPAFNSDSPIHYISSRMYLDHDLWHVLLGYGIEIDDELAIQAFNVAQIKSPPSSLIIAGGLLHLMGKNPVTAVASISKIAQGFQTGKQSQFLLGLRLYDMFESPLADVRRQCGLQAVA